MKKILLYGLGIIATLGFSGCGVIMSQVEHPPYTVEQTLTDNIEIRQYTPQIVAAVTVKGTIEKAPNTGFKQLADFIFGNNIAMTAPVQQSQKIAMTAPVQMTDNNGLWDVEFIMPSEYTMETLPKPANEDVRIFERPGKKFIVIRFSGRQRNFPEYQKILDDYIAKHNIQTVGLPIMAYYNPPWTLPFFKRNEIMYQIKG